MNNKSNKSALCFFCPITEASSIEGKDEASDDSGLLITTGENEQDIDELATFLARTTPFSPTEGKARPSLGAIGIICKSTQSSILSVRRHTSKEAEQSEDIKQDEINKKPTKRAKPSILSPTPTVVTPQSFLSVRSTISPRVPNESELMKDKPIKRPRKAP